MPWLLVMAQAASMAVSAGPQQPPRNVVVSVPPVMVSVPLVMPPTTLPHGPVPTARQGWIVAADYPASAIGLHEQGSTAFTLSADMNGKVTGCMVTASSGSPTLDHATCDLLLERARFAPALDVAGKPVAGSYSSRANWVLPLLRPLPQPLDMAIVYTVETDGRVSGCKPLRGGEADPAGLLGMLAVCSQVYQEPFKDAQGHPVRKKVTISRSITIDPVP